MVEKPDPRHEDAADAESAFMTLSHDLRLAILLALWDAPGYTLSFAALRRAVAERDSGKFTYHLEKLQDHFVAETDEGYELQYPGHRVLDAIQSGVFHDRTAVGPIDLDASCRACGSRLSFTYGTDYVGRIECPDCGEQTMEWPFDPGGTADRSPDEIVAAFDRRTKHAWMSALDGVCPFCAGRIDPALVRRDEEGNDTVGAVDHMYDREAIFEDQPAFVSVDCDQCSFYSFVPVGVVLLVDSDALSRLYRTTAHERTTPLWDLGFVVDSDAVELRSTDNTRVTVTTVDAADPRTFVVGESLTVTAESDG